MGLIDPVNRRIMEAVGALDSAVGPARRLPIGDILRLLSWDKRPSTVLRASCFWKIGSTPGHQSPKPPSAAPWNASRPREIMTEKPPLGPISADALGARRRRTSSASPLPEHRPTDSVGAAFYTLMVLVAAVTLAVRYLHRNDATLTAEGTKDARTEKGRFTGRASLTIVAGTGTPRSLGLGRRFRTQNSLQPLSSARSPSTTVPSPTPSPASVKMPRKVSRLAAVYHLDSSSTLGAWISPACPFLSVDEQSRPSGARERAPGTTSSISTIPATPAQRPALLLILKEAHEPDRPARAAHRGHPPSSFFQQRPAM